MENTSVTRKPMTKDEVIIFINLVENMPILTSKETNAATNKAKEEAWNKVADIYNAKCGGIPRKKAQLKLKWDNLKKSARKRAQAIRMDIMKTGAGKPDHMPQDDILDKVTSMMGSTCSGFTVPFGGDGYIDEEDCDSNELTFIEVTETVEEEVQQMYTTDCTTQSDTTNHDFLTVGSEARHGIHTFSTTNSAEDDKPRKKSKKKSVDGRLEKNLAIARYYNIMSEKISIEIELLKKQREENKLNNK